MRLICPSCDAEYAVDDAAIPPQGRDVQCSNCGHAWFQMHSDAETQADAAPIAPPPPLPAELSSGDPAPAIAAETAASAPPARRQIDDTVLTVLREEAAREAAARRSEAARVIESQPDLGLTQPVSQPTEAEAEHSFTDRPSARRDLLPDIEEINSTLRAARDPRGEIEGETTSIVALPPRRGGFRAGFVGMMVAASMLVAVYVMAPRIAQYLPGAAGTMSAYVETVDRARLWLDAVMQHATGALRGVGGETG